MHPSGNTIQKAWKVASNDIVMVENSVMDNLAAFTEEFVEPFNQLQGLEDLNGDQSPWLNYGNLLGH